MKFKDRQEAGKLLAEKIKKELPTLDRKNTIILAIPRGGVPVAYQVSRKLGIPFSLVVTKKMAPLSEPEAAFGAIAADGTYIVDSELMRYMGVSEEEFVMVKQKAMEEAIKKEKRYISKKPDIEGKDVILIDDGIATGYTAVAAAMYLKKLGAREVVLAVPVCPANSIGRVNRYFDRLVCYHKVDSLYFAVGAYYTDFHQVEDEELLDIIQNAKEEGLYLG